MTRDEAIAQLTGVGQPFELADAEALGRRVRAFRNAPRTLGEMFASCRSDADFLVYEDERYSFEDVWRLSAGLAWKLTTEFGVRKGDRVAISMRNYPEWAIAFNATALAGGIAVAMNALWQPSEMEQALRSCEAKALFVDEERLARLRSCANPPGDMAVVMVRDTGQAGGDGVLRWSELMMGGEREDAPPCALDPDDDAIMLFTSGSTGHPKGAVSTHRNILSALLSWELDYNAAVLTGLFPPAPAAAPQPVMLLGVPLFHVTGLHAAYLSSFRPQRRLVSMYKWDPEKALAIIERERVTNFVAPAAMTGDLVEASRGSMRDLSSLSTVGGGGAARPPEQVRAIDRAFANARPNTGWGMTETNAIGTGIAGQDYLEHPASSGRVSAVLDIRVVDDGGRPVPSGERGELQVRGTSVMRGYWRRPDADAESFDGEWFRTGDVAFIDGDGYLHIVDRIKDLVIRGGENIGCGGVE
jgi:long-chain acyl-CoA synthetase